MRETFDDFLGLESRDFSRHGLLVFHGCSGSGKSTAIEWLLRSHRDFASRDVTLIEGPPLAIPSHPSPLVVIDEIVSPGDLPVLVRLLLRGTTLLVATHLHPAWYRPFHAIARTAVFRTDVDHAKIARHFDRRGIAASPHAIEHYVRRFGANYTDIDIILERCPAPTFDVALARFTKFCALEMR